MFFFKPNTFPPNFHASRGYLGPYRGWVRGRFRRKTGGNPFSHNFYLRFSGLVAGVLLAGANGRERFGAGPARFLTSTKHVKKITKI